MTKLWAALIQKDKKLAPREKMKSRLLKSLRSTSGKRDWISTVINRLKQNRLRRSHPHRRGVDPLPI